MDAPAWLLTIDADDPRSPRVRESLLTVADGIFGTRGSLEEDGPRTIPLVLASGVYDLDNGFERIVEVPSWVTLELSEPLPAGRFVLDMRDGTLRRIVERGGVVALRSRRFASLARPGIMVLDARLSGGLIKAQLTPDVEHDRVLTRFGGGVAVEMHTETSPLPGERTRLVRIASYEADAHERPSSPSTRAKLERARSAGVAQLTQENRAAWRKRWDTADIEIAGQPELTRSVRFALYHLISSVHPSGHSESSLGARGLSGTAYLGHVFWDADVFALPFFAATSPKSALALLRYRINRVAAAKEAARATGRRGAHFPWESAQDGRDVTPRFAQDPGGDLIPILSGVAEEHITADVAWSAWHYASWTGDAAFLRGPGYPLLVETARYWASRISLDADGSAHLRGVVGPDEYHEMVDDNAFTNLMAAWNLERAADVVSASPSGAPTPTGASASSLTTPYAPVDGDEVAEWRRLTSALVTGFDPASGIYEQFAGYGRLESILARELGVPPFPADLVAGRDRIAGSQVIKQADLLMAHFLIPESTVPGSLATNLAHYLPRTCHGSSLSPSVHTALLARAGRAEEAAELLELALDLDLGDLTGTAAGGLHMAAFGGVWQALVRGFAGVTPPPPRLTGSTPCQSISVHDVLTIDPHLPSIWEALIVHLAWRGSPLRIEIVPPEKILLETPAPLTVRIGDSEPRHIPTGITALVYGD